MSGAPPRARRMVSLGKVTAPKPVNLPSQKKENNGNDPAINLVPKGSGTWGENLASAPSTQSSHADTSSEVPKLPPRAIPAAPTAAWGGAGLPEERKRALEIASREEFPTLAATEFGAERQRSRPSSEMRQAVWDDDERNFAGFHDDHEAPSHRGERWGEHGSYYDRDRQLYSDRDRSFGPPDSERYGPGPGWDRYDRSRPPPPDWERHGPEERYQGYREGQGYHDHDRYDPHGPPDDRYGPPRPQGPPPTREYGYHDEDYHGPLGRRYYDGPPRGEGDYDRDHRRPYAEGNGPYRGPPRHDRYPSNEYARHGADFYPRVPPPPPPPRRKEQTPEPSSSLASTPPKHANGVPLERSASLQSGSTQLSDSTAVSSRRATLGSSIPRSDWGSAAGESQAAADAGVEEGKDAPSLQGERVALISGEQAVGRQQKLEGHAEEASFTHRQPAQAANEQKERPMSHMQPLGAPPRKSTGKPVQVAAQPQQHSASDEQAAPPKVAFVGRREGQGTPVSPTSQQQTTPTKILKREAPLAQQPSTAAGAPAPATSHQPSQQQQQEQQSQGTVRPPPPPPPRQQQQQQQQPAPVVAAESAARAAQVNLGAALSQQGRTGGWGQSQRHGRGQQHSSAQQAAGHSLANGGAGRQQMQKPVAGASQGSKPAEEELQLDVGISLPTQDSLMHHIASPERQQMLHVMPTSGLGHQQRQGQDLNGIARSMLPAPQPRLPVSVTAQFAPSQGAQQSQQQVQALPQQLMQLSLAGLGGRPGAQVMYTGLPVSGALSTDQQQAQRLMYAAGGFMMPAQQAQHAPSSSAGTQIQQAALQGLQISQQQLFGLQHDPLRPSAAAGPNSSMPQPLMTFGNMPQEVHVGIAQAPAPAAQAVQPVLQFGNVVLPDTIEGSVEETAHEGGSSVFKQQHEYTAEQQHAFMKAKAAEKIRLLHEQEARRKQEEERRLKHRSAERSQQHGQQRGFQQQLIDTAPPPPPRRPGSAQARPPKDRTRGRPDLNVQGQQLQEPESQLQTQAQRQTDPSAGRGQSGAGRGGRGGRGRGRGRSEMKATAAGDSPQNSAQPQSLPGGNTAVVEVRKQNSKQQPKAKADKAGNGPAPPLPPGLTPGTGSSKGQTAGNGGAATATVVVVEGQRSASGKKGGSKVPAAPRRGDSQQTEASSNGELSDQAAPARGSGRGSRSRATGSGRGGRPRGEGESAPSSATSDAGDNSKQPSTTSSVRGRGRGRGAFGGRAAVKTVINQGDAKLVEST